MIVDSTLLSAAAYRSRWTSVASDGDALVFTDRRHPGCLRMEPDGDAVVLVSVDIVDEDALAAAFPGWPLDGSTLHLPVDPPKGDNFLDFLPAVLDALASLASGNPPPVAPPAPPAPVAAFATDREQIILARNGQGRYRDALLALWDGACAVTGLSTPEFLVASHAKPWKKASDAERLDGANGLPLVPNLDKLFDGGWIAFEDDGSVRISPSLAADDARILGADASLRLRKPLSDAQKRYLRYHREHVFRAAPQPASEPAPPPAPPPQPDPPTSPQLPPVPPPVAPASDPWDELLAQFPEGDEFRSFAEQAQSAGHAGVTVPEAWFDLSDGHGGTVATAILAWPSEKVALVRDEEVADCAPLQRQGWTIASPSDPSPFIAFLAL